MADKIKEPNFRNINYFCQKQFGKLPIFVFVDRTGKQLTSNAVKNMFKRLKEIMNFSNVRCCAYDFRHTFAHRFLMNGGRCIYSSEIIKSFQSFLQ
jgi:integrase/recombinase XerD